MKTFLMPAFIVFAGVVSLVSPLMATGDCGLNPTIFLPSKCVAPHEAPAYPTGSVCMKLGDGSCYSSVCHGTAWSNAIPGICKSAIITENNVPRCESAFAVTNVMIREYSLSCSPSGATCTCQLTATGRTNLVPVCNCRDLAPLN